MTQSTGLHRPVHVVRLGQSTWDEQALVHGPATAPPLTELGRAQAVDAAIALHGVLASRATLVTCPSVRDRGEGDLVIVTHGSMVRCLAALLAGGGPADVATVAAPRGEVLTRSLY